MTAEAGPNIKELRLRNFKCLADVRVPLKSRLVLLIGQNASGKSSVLDGAHILTRLCAPQRGDHENYRSQVVFKNRLAVERLVSRSADPPELDLALASSDCCFWVRGRAGARGGVFGLGVGAPDLIERQGPERRGVFESWVGNTQDLSSLARRPGSKPGIPSERDLLGRPELAEFGAAVRLRLSADAAIMTSVPSSREPRVNYDGAGLPSVIAWLASVHPDRREALEADLALIVPGAGRVRAPNESVEAWEVENVQFGEEVVPRRVRREAWGHSLEVEMASAGFVPADLLSEGTVLTLALLAVLHSPTCPRLVLLDDIDRGLHPQAQRQLVKSLREILARRSDVQIIATTHSPYLLDQFEGDEVCVLARDVTGKSHSRLLSEHPSHDEWKATLHSGEFWSTVGEDWVIDPRGGDRDAGAHD